MYTYLYILFFIYIPVRIYICDRNNSTLSLCSTTPAELALNSSPHTKPPPPELCSSSVTSAPSSPQLEPAGAAANPPGPGGTPRGVCHGGAAPTTRPQMDFLMEN